MKHLYKLAYLKWIISTVKLQPCINYKSKIANLILKSHLTVKMFKKLEGFVRFIGNKRWWNKVKVYGKYNKSTPSNKLLVLLGDSGGENLLIF